MDELKNKTRHILNMAYALKTPMYNHLKVFDSLCYAHIIKIGNKIHLREVENGILMGKGLKPKRPGKRPVGKISRLCHIQEEEPITHLTPTGGIRSARTYTT
ncbi:hypothetical protein CR513_14650, partial [Mucuna pruriens]